MVTERRKKIKAAISSHKQALKNKVRYTDGRDALVYQILNSPVPRWGGLTLNLMKI